jgi:hypothetical protein
MSSARLSPPNIYAEELSCNTWVFLFCQYHRLKLKFIKPYTLQLKQRFQHPYLASPLPEDEQALLASIFTPAERAVAEYRWLRTCYSDANGSPTDQAYASLLAQSGLLHIDGSDIVTFILDDAARYNYGPEWQKIFLRIPQLVDRPPYKSISPADFEAGKNTAIQEYEEQMEAENFHRDPETSSQSSDEDEYDNLYLSAYHAASVIGTIWIADSEALLSGKVLLVWFDDHGRTGNYISLLDAHAHPGILGINANNFASAFSKNAPQPYPELGS